MPQLSELVVDIARSYPSYREAGAVDSKARAYQLVVRDFPDELERIARAARPYKFEGSTGRGNVTPAPWIAVLDPAVTDTARRGYYVVYLYSTNLSRVYASLALGVTEFEETHGSNRAMLSKLDDVAAKLASHLVVSGRFHVGPIDLASRNPTSLHGKYEHSSIVAVEYEIADPPGQKQMEEDLRQLLTFYERLRVEVGPTVDEEESLVGVEEPEKVLVEVVPFVPRPRRTKKTSTSGTAGGHRRSPAARKIGNAGERIVLHYEKARLCDAGRQDLADRVRWVADEGEFPGYDILSFNEDGEERCIEVKSSKGRNLSVIELTENERRAIMEAPSGRYWLYLVSGVFTKKPRITPIVDPARQLSWDETNPTPSSWTLALG